jgi:hypothetical protein
MSHESCKALGVLHHARKLFCLQFFISYDLWVGFVLDFIANLGMPIFNSAISGVVSVLKKLIM